MQPPPERVLQFLRRNVGIRASPVRVGTRRERRVEAGAVPKDTRPNAEQIQAAKEEAAATQAASDTQAKNGVRLGYASKRAAADRALAAALNQTTGQTQTRTRLIQSLAEYSAILSTFAAEVAKYDALANDPNTTPEDAIKYGCIRDMLPLLGDIKNADSARSVSSIAAVKLVGSEGWARWRFQQLQIQENRKIARAALVQDMGKTGGRSERRTAEKAAASLFGKARAILLNIS